MKNRRGWRLAKSRYTENFSENFAPVMRWAAMKLLAVSAICVYCLPEHIGVAVAVFAAALIYQIGMGYLVDAEARKAGNGSKPPK